MASKLVTYDLRAPGRDYSTLMQAIKNYPKWGRVCESTWVIVTTDTCVTVRDNLQRFIDSNDRLFVAELTGVAAWYNTICDSEWLKENL